MKKIVFISIATALALFSCAKRPDAIVPADVPMAAYNGLSCEQLAGELDKERKALSAVSKQQNNAATGDAVGVFLLAVPASTVFGGDKEGEVAVAKGKVMAIENSLKAKGCR